MTSFGALGSDTIAWHDLRGIRLREQRNPFAFAALGFRSLQQVVDLEADDRSITINAPAGHRHKQAIVNAFERHVPEARRDLIAELEKW